MIFFLKNVCYLLAYCNWFVDYNFLNEPPIYFRLKIFLLYVFHFEVPWAPKGAYPKYVCCSRFVNPKIGVNPILFECIHHLHLTLTGILKTSSHLGKNLNVFQEGSLKTGLWVPSGRDIRAMEIGQCLRIDSVRKEGDVSTPISFERCPIEPFETNL